jgi:hypothetical protein
MLIVVTLMMEVICSSETSVLARATWHHIPEEGNLQAKQNVLASNLLPPF